MKKSELYREWARVLDMCEGTNVNPDFCWKYDGEIANCMASLNTAPERHQFAVAILEDKPVFVGDTVFDDNIPTVIDLSTKYILFNDKHDCSWSAPKKTFNLEVNASHLESLSKITFADVYILDLAKMAKEILSENTK